MCIAEEEKKCLDNHQNPNPFFFSFQYHVHMINMHLLLITFFCYVFMSLGPSSLHIFIHLMIQNKELNILLKNNIFSVSVCLSFIHFGMSQNIVLFLKIKLINLLIFLLYPYLIFKTI